MAEEFLTQIRRRFMWVGISLGTILLTGTVGYRIISGGKSSWLDCFYMTFITVATIGFGEIIDMSHNPAGRIFTMVICLAGIGVMTYILMAVTSFVVEGEMSEAFRRRRMAKMIDKLREHFIVCGFEGTTRYIVEELQATRRPFVVVGQDREEMSKLAGLFPDVACLDGDPTDGDTLERACIALARGIFAVTGDDNLNLVVALTARQLNPGIRVVVSCREMRNAEKMKRVGADAIVSPTFIGGLRMASEMIRPTVVSFLDVMLSRRDENLRVEEVLVPVSFAGRPIADLGLARFARLLLLAVKDNDGWSYNPPRSRRLRAGETLVFMSTPEEKKDLESLFAGGG